MSETRNAGRCATSLLAGALVLLAGCGEVDVGAVLREAVAHGKVGEWPRALTLTRKCLAAEANNVCALTLTGICLYQVGRPAEAIEPLERAAALAPDEFSPQFFYGWVLCEQGRFAEALPVLEKANQFPAHKAEVLALLSRCCLERTAFKGVSYLQGLRRFPEFDRGPEIYTGLGVLWLGQGEAQRALASFQTALAKAPDNPAVLQNLAVFHDAYGTDPSLACDYYRACLAACKKSGDQARERVVVRRLRELAVERHAPTRRGTSP